MTVIQGNCIDKLGEIQNETIDLIYLDPPFFTQKLHSLNSRDNSQKYKFSDKWDSLEDYLKFIKKCLRQCRRILKETGSVFLHCDKSASHNLRVLLDDIFGAEYFQSEIIWAYKRWSNRKKGLLNCHQNIYFYTKTKNFKFNTIYTNYSLTTNIDQILQQRKRDERGKVIYQRDETGTIITGNEKLGVPLSNVWYIPYLNPKAKERVGYPTQKPVLLLEQIIKIASDENDIILDPFCGSGTTLVAAKILNRKFVGIDISKEAVKLTHKRLDNIVKTRSALLEKGQGAYLEKNLYEIKLLETINATPVQRNKGIDGFLKEHYLGKPVSVKIQKPNETIEEAKNRLITASKTKNCKLMIVMKTNNLSENSFLPDDNDNLLIIDSYNLLISDWIKSKNGTQKISGMAALGGKQ